MCKNNKLKRVKIFAYNKIIILYLCLNICVMQEIFNNEGSDINPDIFPGAFLGYSL